MKNIRELTEIMRFVLITECAVIALYYIVTHVRF